MDGAVQSGERAAAEVLHLTRHLAIGVGWRGMILYTCGTKKMGPGFAHPCAKAGKALDAAGYEYELKTVGGYRLMPWTWGSREQDRAEITKLSGTPEVPILVLDDGQVISGSSTIARWANEHPHSPAKSGA